MSDEKRPEVFQGQDVLWYPGGDEHAEPLPAKVTAVGQDRVVVALAIFHPNNYNLMLRDGVRHMSDPKRKQPELQENGAWDHTPLYKRFVALETKLTELVG